MSVPGFDPNHRYRIYLAGPEVFLPDARVAGQRKTELAALAGFEGVFPLDAGLDLTGLPASEQASRIAIANEALMRSCDLLIANLTPFRGASMDAGTAFEVGYMRALGRPVLGYTNVTGDYAARARYWRQHQAIETLGRCDCDRPDIAIEDFGLAENLMIAIAIAQSGGVIIDNPDPAAVQPRMDDLGGFRACLDQARALFPIGS